MSVKTKLTHILKLAPRTNTGLGPKSITTKNFSNAKDVYDRFISGNDISLLDLSMCSYFARNVIVSQRKLDKTDLGINALVSFIKTQFHNDELILKKFKDAMTNDSDFVSKQFINEVIVSAILSREYFNAAKPLFTIGVMYAAFTCQGFGYMILEKYNKHLNAVNFKEMFGRYPSNIELVFIVMQVLITLRILQDKYKFTHYDLHSGNILFKELSNNDVIGGKVLNKSTCVLTFNNTAVEFPRPTFIVKIIDFGYARVKINNKIVYNPYPKFREFKDFNPFYDTVYFLNSISYSFRVSNPDMCNKIDSILSFVKFDKHHRPENYFSDQSLQYTILYDKLTNLFETNVPKFMIKPASSEYDLVVK